MRVALVIIAFATVAFTLMGCQFDTTITTSSKFFHKGESNGETWKSRAAGSTSGFNMAWGRDTEDKESGE